MPILPRDIYHIDDFPPLDGREPKGRFAIVILPPTEDDDFALVVGITNEPQYVAGRDPIPVPNRKTHPGATTGLYLESWALPDWRVRVHKDLLHEQKNTRPLDFITFKNIAREVLARAAKGNPAPELTP